MNGIVFPKSDTRGKTKPNLSKRMKTLVDKQKKRVLVYRNEDYSDGKEIIANAFQKVDYERRGRGGGQGPIFIYSCSQSLKIIDFKRNYLIMQNTNM